MGITTNPRVAALVGAGFVVPFLTANAIVGSQIEPFFSLIRPGFDTSPGEYVLLAVVMLLIPVGAFVAARPMLRLNADGTRRFYAVNAVVATVLAVAFFTVAIGLGSDIYRCDVLGIANCDQTFRLSDFEWTAIADSEAGVLLAMARCLQELGEGRAPRQGWRPPLHFRSGGESSERVSAAMQQRGARILGMAGALVVVGFALTVVSVDPSQGEWAVILYSIVAAAILLAPRRWAAWVATAGTVPIALLTLVIFANYLPADGLILLTATLALGGAALALHRGPRREDST